MFSYEQRIKAVKLYLKYKSWAAVIHELGYPSRGALIQWVKEYSSNGKLRKIYTRRKKYSEDEIVYAVNYYKEHGRNMAKTMRDIGYPNRDYLKRWLIERDPHFKYTCRKSSSLVQFTEEDKKQAVIDLCIRNTSASYVAEQYHISRTSLYNWKNELLEDKELKIMPRKKSKSTDELQDEIKTLQMQADELRNEVYRLQLEKDVLEKVAEIIKKDPGITLKKLTNREKAIVIDTLRNKYSLKELLSVFHMAKSSYCYQKISINAGDKYQEERKLIINYFHVSNETYGYRRIYLDLKDNKHRISEKIIRRIMKEENLSVKRIKKKKYNSYQGEISPAVENIIKRNFKADKPNEKWLTDITEFAIPAGKVYLSPLIDCFDGLPVSWTIGIHPNADLVNTMLDLGIATLKKDEHPLVHSDRGAHYRWPGWIKRMDNAGLKRSMSKKGCSPDNSACEGFFGRLKNEMFYGRDWKNTSIDEFIDILNKYIHWYAEKRRKVSLGGISPMEYRRKLGIVL